MPIYTYSSGSRDAQEQFLRNTKEGDAALVGQNVCCCIRSRINLLLQSLHSLLAKLLPIGTWNNRATLIYLRIFTIFSCGILLAYMVYDVAKASVDRNIKQSCNTNLPADVAQFENTIFPVHSVQVLAGRHRAEARAWQLRQVSIRELSRNQAPPLRIKPPITYLHSRF